MRWMTRALEEARRAEGLTSPNPAVGAVVVKHEREVAAGYHERAGQAHAEVRALEAAGDEAVGADLYVTLEPCSTSGKTPPCVDAIRRSGIARVIVGCVDANPRHAGRGVDRLRADGIDVEVGVLEEACRRLNEAFFHWVRTGRAFVTLKLAATLDGRIATASGESQWITGPEARSEVQKLRRAADAILVGAETVRLDDPSLRVREPADWPRQPARFVWTRSDPGSFDPTLQVLRDESLPPTRFVRPRGTPQWTDFLTELGAESITSLLVEGGGELAAEMLRSGAVDKLVWFVAPRILGGAGSRPAVGGADPRALSECVQVQSMQVAFCGRDVILTGYPQKPGGEV